MKWLFAETFARLLLIWAVYIVVAVLMARRERRRRDATDVQPRTCFELSMKPTQILPYATPTCPSKPGLWRFLRDLAVLAISMLLLLINTRPIPSEKGQVYPFLAGPEFAVSVWLAVFVGMLYWRRGFRRALLIACAVAAGSFGFRCLTYFVLKY